MRCIRGLIYFWLIASTPVLGMTGFAQGTFLCWGGDGSFGIGTEICDPHGESASSSSDHEESSDHGDHADEDSCCEPCIDIPLPSGGAIKHLPRSGSGSVLRCVMVCAAPHAEPIVAGHEAAKEYFRCPRPGGGEGAVASLRTIVLLI
jgi:hypothetical protein